MTFFVYVESKGLQGYGPYDIEFMEVITELGPTIAPPEDERQLRRRDRTIVVLPQISLTHFIWRSPRATLNAKGT